MPIAAWGMWLLFCYAIVRRHGLEALKAVSSVAKAFPVTAWVTALRGAIPMVQQLLGRGEKRSRPPPS
jgi:hypothetical protein